MKKAIPYGALWACVTATICAVFLISQISNFQSELDQLSIRGPLFGGMINFGQVAGARTSNRQNFGGTDFIRGQIPTLTPIPTPTPTAGPTQIVSSGTGKQTTSPAHHSSRNGFSALAPSHTPTVTPINLSFSKPTPTPTVKTSPTPTPKITPTPTPTPTSFPTVANTALVWGAYAGDNLTDAAVFETLVGKKINIQAIFLDMGSDSFPSEYAPTIRDQNKTLLIFWEPNNLSLDAINSGSADNYIKTFAADAKTYGGPVILSLFHEMNGNWDPWDGTVGGNTPAKLIAAWKHTHDLFAGATNVKFGWAVNNDSVPDTSANSIAAYYPGSSYVDYVGVDGFNFGNPWETWDQVFPTSLMQQLSAYGKPVYILSTASAAGPQKPQWITDMSTGIAKYHIAGFIWFNQNKEQNWLINSDLTSLVAFKAILP